MDRRALLAGAAAAIGAACVPPLRVEPSATAEPIDWAGLRRSMTGPVARPGDAGYDAARVLYNTRFDVVRPQAVAMCATVDDVRASIDLARRHRLPLAIRSGGHSWIGASTGTGMVLDVSKMDWVAVGADRVSVGPGARTIDVHAALGQRGRGIPAATSAPTVAMSGLTLGGGIGGLSRAWGLTCDALVAAEIVTADGALRACDATNEPELFWALRGGGGGSFGVVTSLTFRTFRADRVAVATLGWPWPNAAKALRAWQRWIFTAPDETWSDLRFEGQGGSDPDVGVHAIHLGSAGELNGRLDALAQAVGAPPLKRFAIERSYLDAMLIEAGCGGLTVAECHLRPRGRLERETFLASSAVLHDLMGDSALQTAVESMGRIKDFPRAATASVIFEPLGGEIARIRREATAFPYRTAFGLMRVLASWEAGAPKTIVDASTAWHQVFMTSLRATTSGALYVNHPVTDLVDPRPSYFDTNYERLRRVKKMYDPTDVFSHPQSIPLP
jgi:FAD/FMN-containing dehydrogenase